MLLYPFEEQFDVPALSVEFCNSQSFVSQMVGKEAVDLTGSEVFICDHSESLGITPGWLDSCKFDDLIADYTSFKVTASGLNNFIQHIILIEPEWIFRIQRTDSLDESLSEVSVYTPVP